MVGCVVVSCALDSAAALAAGVSVILASSPLAIALSWLRLLRLRVPDPVEPW
jgi:hypothetical protein